MTKKRENTKSGGTKPLTQKQLEKQIRAKIREEQKAKKAHRVKIDGEIIPLEVEKIRNAIRLVWSQNSIARRICLKSATDKDGFGTCKSCKRIVPKLYADHIEVMGSIFAPDYISRMWCHSSKLQPLCAKCHNKKTKEEREAQAKALMIGKDSVKTNDTDDEDFY